MKNKTREQRRLSLETQIRIAYIIGGILWVGVLGLLVWSL